MNISEAREKRSLTQTDVAKYLGVTQGAVSQWENGMAMPRVELLPKLAELLGCTVDELLRPQAEEKEKTATPA